LDTQTGAAPLVQCIKQAVRMAELQGIGLGAVIGALLTMDVLLFAWKEYTAFICLLIGTALFSLVMLRRGQD